VPAGAWVAQMVAGREFARVKHGDHVDTGNANAHGDEPAPGTRVQIREASVERLTLPIPLPAGSGCATHQGGTDVGVTAHHLRLTQCAK